MEKIVEIVEKAIAQNGLEKAIAVNVEMMEYLMKASPEKIFDYEGKMEMVIFVKEYLSKK
jgi:hypothetical protein